MAGRWGEIPFAALAPCLAAGIAISRQPIPYWFPALVVAAAALAGASCLALGRGQCRVALGLALTAIVLDGFMIGVGEKDRYANDDVRSMLTRRMIIPGELLLLDGCVLEDAVPKGSEQATTLQLHGIRRNDRWYRCTGKAEFHVAVSNNPEIPAISLTTGDRVRAWAVCDLPRNYKNPGSADRVAYLARRGIHIVARVKSPVLVEMLPGDCGTPWSLAAASMRQALKEKLRRFSDHGFSQQAAVLSSIMLGDDHELSSDTRTRFQSAGVYHVLVVSGLHVGWIAWIMLSIFRLFRISKRAGGLLAAGGIFFYTYLVGFQAGISRAFWMFTFYLAGRSLSRKAVPANIVFACAFLLLSLRPGWLEDAGFQLSFLAVSAITLMGLPAMEGFLRPLLEPLKHAGDPDILRLEEGSWHERGRRLRYKAEICMEALADRCPRLTEYILIRLCRTAAHLGWWIGGIVLITTCVQLWLEPLLVLYFNRLSWIAPAANLVVVPLSCLALAAGVVFQLLSVVSGGTGRFFQLAALPCSLLLDVTNWLASLPGAWQRCPTPPVSWVFAGLCLILFWCLLRWRHLWIPCAFIGLELVLLALVSARMLPRPDALLRADLQRWGVPVNRSPLRITFLDVGQGDSIVIQFPDTRVWVVDAGGGRAQALEGADTDSFDIGEAIIGRFLWSRWIVGLDRIIMSHPHLDHAGGILSLLRNFPADRLDHGSAVTGALHVRVLESARRARVPAFRLTAGEEHNVSGVVVRVLHPGENGLRSSLNDESVVVQLNYGHFSALLAGDLEGQGESEVMARTSTLRSDLLKVAHHGSRNATLNPFLDRVQPRWAVISAARKNPFGNPSPEVLQRLLRRGARLLLTMDQGAIFVETDGIRYIIRSHALGRIEEGRLLNR